MESKKIFAKYYSRLAREGILKAIICGIIIGFAVDFVFALITSFSFVSVYFEFWFLVAIGTGLVIGGTSATILYFKVFRPTSKKIARRVDELGLDERLITMIELENDDSYIAMRQREDAKAKLNEINSKTIKFSIAKSLIATAVIIGVFGVSMTTVNALVGHRGMDPIDDYFNPDADSALDQFMVSYVVNDELGGWIEGEADQLVDFGGSTTPVIAVAEDGYMFMGWDEDGSLDPERSDSNVISDMVLTAVFVAFETDPNEDGDLDTEEPVERPEDLRDPTIPDPDQDNPPSDQGEQDKYNESNMIHEGQTPYQDLIEEYYQEALDAIMSGNYTEEEVKIIEAYFDLLRAGAEALEE